MLPAQLIMDQFSLLSATVIIYHIKPYPFYYFFKILFTVEIFYKSCLFEEDEAKVEVMPALEHSVMDHTDRGLPEQLFVPLARYAGCTNTRQICFSTKLSHLALVPLAVHSQQLTRATHIPPISTTSAEVFNIY